MSQLWMTKVAEVLRAAAHIHARRGGAKNTMMDSKGRVCLWGAIGCALGWTGLDSLSNFSYLTYQIGAVLSTVFDDYSPYPGANWNDLSTTTDEDVQKLLLQVADQCEIGEVTLRVQ